MFRNTGEWETNPSGSLVLHQTLNIPSAQTGTTTGELVFADVTGTNGADLLLAGQDFDGAGFLWIYPSNGDGTFDDGLGFVQIRVSNPVRGLVADDFDGDGDIDVIAAVGGCDSFAERLVTFENDLSLNGIWVVDSVPLSIGNGTGPGDLAAGDFYDGSSGQGFVDLVTANSMHPSYTSIHNQGLWVFVPTTVSAGLCPGGANFATVGSGFFGTDSHWDFVGVDPDDLKLSVSLGDGLGAFSDADCYTLFSPSGDDVIRAHGVDSGNFNNGPTPDVAVALRYVETPESDGPGWGGAVAVVVGRADGSFQTHSPARAYIFPTGGATSHLVEVADMDADGFDDVVVTNGQDLITGQTTLSVLINKLFVAAPAP